VGCQDGPLMISRMLSWAKLVLTTDLLLVFHLSTTLGVGVCGITPWTV